jgi:phosphoglycolate phosphatase
VNAREWGHSTPERPKGFDRRVMEHARTKGKPLPVGIPFKAIIFDLDGTLVDSLPGIQYSLDAAFSRFPIVRTTTDVRSLIGPPIRSILTRLARGATERDLDNLEKAFRSSYDSEGWKRTACFPGVPETLAQIAEQGVGRYLVTQKPCAVARRMLRKLQLDRFLTDVVTRDTTSPALASKRDMLDYLIGKHHLCPDKSLMVGDTRDDLAAAVSLGVRVAIVSFGYGSQQIDFASEEVLLVDRFEDLLLFQFISG